MDELVALVHHHHNEHREPSCSTVCFREMQGPEVELGPEHCVEVLARLCVHELFAIRWR